MHFLSFATKKQSEAPKSSWGAVLDGGVVDLGSRFGGSLQQAIASGELARSGERALGLAADFSLDDTCYLPPITAPEKIICIGVNYAKRNEEYQDGSKAPAYPSVFMRAKESLTAHQQDLIRPPESHQFDYEGEIAIVIGKGGRRIPEAQAAQHIAGLTLMNEGTLRDWLRHAKFNVTQGKNFVSSGSIGPWLVTADEFAERGYNDLRLRTKVNGELRQDDTTANLMFPFHYIISYLSTFFMLRPGDVIATGTPLGAGARFDPPRYLVPGDLIEVEVEGIGCLANGVRDEHMNTTDIRRGAP